jgi:hypothetical protein
VKKGADGSRDSFREIRFHVDRDAAEELPETKREQGHSLARVVRQRMVLSMSVKFFTGILIFPLEIEKKIRYIKSCDRRPVRFGPLAQLVRAVGS